MVKSVNKNEPWYLGQRAEHLAVMYLTRRSDLLVTKQEADVGLDLLVTICKEGVGSGRIFGVQIEAAVSARKSRKDDKTIHRTLEESAHAFYQDVPFPVCLFFFTMEDDQGYYRWIKEPVLESKGDAKLIVNRSDVLVKLTDSEIDHIVSKVSSWYESLTARR